MNFSSGQKTLLVTVILIVGVFFTVQGFVQAKGFLAPLTVAILLGMMFSPLSNRMENWGLSRGLSSLVSISIAMLFFIGMFFLVSFQVRSIASDWPEIEKEMKPKVGSAQEWLANKTGMSSLNETNLFDLLPGKGKNTDEQSSEQNSNNSESKNSGSSLINGNSILKSAGSAVMGFFNFLSVALLTVIYLFFLLNYRGRLKKSILNFISDDGEDKAEKVMKDAVNLSQGYLVGRFLLILFLAILYAIGLSISGVKHAVLISIIAAVLTFLPYVGNIIGFVLAIAMAMFSGGELGVFIGVCITFFVAQFVENYILQPYVVGEKVSLNPLAIIIVVVLGGSIWGVVGMVIFIPLFGIIKIVCDHVPMLKPVGFLLGNDGMDSKDEKSSLKKLWNKLKGS